MKKNSLLILLLFFASRIISQTLSEDEVPLSVQSAIKKVFPGAEIKFWQKNSYNHYEAEFDWEDHRTTAFFNGSGLLQRTKTIIPRGHVPDTVLKHAKILYPDYEITNTALIDIPDGKLFFDVEMSRHHQIRSLLFFENGQFRGEDVYEKKRKSKKKK